MEKITEIGCLVCFSNSYTKVLRQGTAEVLRCLNCDHIYGISLNGQGRIKYDAEYYKKHSRWFSQINSPLYNKIYSLLQNHRVNSVLDIGSGNGAFLEFLSNKKGFETLVGIDLALLPEKKGVEFIKKDFLDYKSQKLFHSIVCLGVLQFVSQNLNNFVKNIGENLEDKGIAIILVPNENNLLHLFSRLLFRWGVKFPADIFYFGEASNFFTRQSISRLFKQHGLNEIDYFSCNMPFWSIDTFTKSKSLDFALRSFIWSSFKVSTILKRQIFQVIVVQK